MCVVGVMRLDDPQWIPLMEQAVSVIYQLAEGPDIIAGALVKRLARLVLTRPATVQSSVTPGDSAVAPPGGGAVASASGSTVAPPGDGVVAPASGSTVAPPDDSVVAPPGDGAMAPPGGSVVAPPGGGTVDGRVLARFLSLLGQVALAQLVHLDVDVVGELKRRRRVREEGGKARRRTGSKVGNYWSRSHEALRLTRLRCLTIVEENLLNIVRIY